MKSYGHDQSPDKSVLVVTTASTNLVVFDIKKGWSDSNVFLTVDEVLALIEQLEKWIVLNTTGVRT